MPSIKNSQKEIWKPTRNKTFKQTRDSVLAIPLLCLGGGYILFCFERTFSEIRVSVAPDFLRQPKRGSPSRRLSVSTLTSCLYRPFVREFLKGVWGKRNISLAKYYHSNGTLRCSSARSFPHKTRPIKYLTIF